MSKCIWTYDISEIIIASMRFYLKVNISMNFSTYVGPFFRKREGLSHHDIDDVRPINISSRKGINIRELRTCYYVLHCKPMCKFSVTCPYSYAYNLQVTPSDSTYYTYRYILSSSCTNHYLKQTIQYHSTLCMHKAKSPFSIRCKVPYAK